VDLIGTRGTARYETRIGGALTDATPMQLSGPTPAEIRPDWRLTHVSPPSPRAEVAAAADLAEIRRRVRAVVDELAPLRSALHLDGPIMVRVRFDRDSGRLILDTPQRPATTVEESPLGGEEPEGVSESGRQVLGREITLRLRKDLVAAPGVPDISQGIPTAFNAPLPSYTERRRRRGAANPFAPEHGLGLFGRIREERELDRSAEQLRTRPDDFDVGYWPDVRVDLAEERYCYDFRVSGINIDTVCVDPTMRTEGCVRIYTPTSYSLRSDPTFRDQQAGGETFHAPVSLRVTTFPVRFVMYTPSESPGGDTFNHEMHHMIDSYHLVQSLKDRMARRIRARLMEIRRLAAENPQLKDSLLSRQTIFEIVKQENRPFNTFIEREFVARGDLMHTREADRGLPPYQTELPASWDTFQEPALAGGTAGSFDHRPCR
jgi:hypothetical protein